MADTAPLQRVLTAGVPAVSTAGDDEDTVIAQAPFDCTVVAVEYVPEAAITGADGNSRAVSVVNKGADGAGATEVAALEFASGTDASANDETALALSGTAADADLDGGDTLQWRSLAVGTGMADPGGLVRVTVERR
ncbi:hypothetical protein [Streptomonospora wellingtoniae]|uniref:DUF2190 family protein n=1 Tax=Streptomonospora wellingtoniae TaxID=3075544 RepID=A0ABU2KUP1_9ACTN|nr:hypothetical protein [Streptomonospora sp. DSM 45055]MDT0302906.1 hypothetical protein [Streptomonospora sp. DSM 45055]